MQERHVGVTLGIGQPVSQPTNGSNLMIQDTCAGCDDPEAKGHRRYAVTFEDGDRAVVVYCVECALLAGSPEWSPQIILVEELD